MSTFGALLKGIALKQASMHMHLNPSCTYEQLRDYLIKTLDRQQDLAAQLKLETRYRKEGESLQEFAAELRQCAYDAFATYGCPPAMIDVIVLQVFHRNLKGKLGEEVRAKFSKTIEEAVAAGHNGQRRLQTGGPDRQTGDAVGGGILQV